MTGTVHIVAAGLALMAGLAVFARPKGTAPHRWLGRCYAVLMLVVNVSALATFEETGEAGPFHYLAVLSLATVLAGLGFLFFARSVRIRRAVHGYLMAWSWVGLFAAGASQLATMAWPGVPGVTVAGTSLAVCAIAGYVIHSRMPGILGSMPAPPP